MTDLKSPYAAEGTCGTVEWIKSHGGGTDYPPPCVQPVGKAGTHKGDHVDTNGKKWRNTHGR